LVPAIAANVPEQALPGLRNNPNVQSIEPDGTFTANDTIADELTGTWGVSRIGAGTSATAGAGVKVAVIDTGIDCNHPELKRDGVTICDGGWDFVNNDNDPFDDNGHGTHVAGTIAAAKNGSGVVGVAPGVRLYALKVLGANGSGSFSSVIAALQWAVNNGIQVTNNSYGSGGDPGATVEAAFINANNAGVLNVASAGNSGACPPVGDTVGYPGHYDSVMAVAATASNDTRACFSSNGPDVEIAAPGSGVKSTVPGGGYASWSGTSMASPHVAGVAALVIASGIADGNSNGRINDDVRARLQATATDLGTAGRDSLFGFGLVNAVSSLDIGSNTPPTVTISTPANLASFTQGTSVSFTGSAVDEKDGSLTGALGWISSLQGAIGGGAAFSTTTLIAGTHTITASAQDSDGLTGSKSIQVTIKAPAPAATARVTAISYSTAGGKGGKKDLVIKVTVLNQSNAAVANASVSLSIAGPGGPYAATVVTGSNGSGSAKLTSAPSGTYASTVTALSAAGYTVNLTTPSNSYTKP
jgi:subtilisin family serine protease